MHFPVVAVLLLSLGKAKGDRGRLEEQLRAGLFCQPALSPVNGSAGRDWLGSDLAFSAASTTSSLPAAPLAPSLSLLTVKKWEQEPSRPVSCSGLGVTVLVSLWEL